MPSKPNIDADELAYKKENKNPKMMHIGYAS